MYHSEGSENAMVGQVPKFTLPKYKFQLYKGKYLHSNFFTSVIIKMTKSHLIILMGTSTKYLDVILQVCIQSDTAYRLHPVSDSEKEHLLPLLSRLLLVIKMKICFK